VTAGLLEIGVVARELGVAPSTLRTWERRYRVVIPHRGTNGERLYDSEQIAVLRRVLSQLRRGARARSAHDAVRILQPIRTSRLRIHPSPQAPSQARRVVDGLLDDVDDPRFAFNLRLVASELVKNSVLYGSDRDPVRIEIRLFPGYAELCVENGGRPLSIKSLRTRRREGGRGLEIVDALAKSWSIDTGAFGTRITVRLPIEPV